MVLEVAEPIKGYLKKTHEGLKFQKTVVVGGGDEVMGGVQCEFSLQISLQHGVTPHSLLQCMYTRPMSTL